MSESMEPRSGPSAVTSAPENASSADKPREAAPDGVADEVAQLRQALLEKDETVRGMREQILRAQADFENYKRRQQKALEENQFQAAERIIAQLLPLVDNLERALVAVAETSDVAALEKGLTLILRQVKEILGKEGLSEIEADGRHFDPHLHQAVLSEERDDVPDQTILETFQKGFRLGSRTLRPSLVKVARSSQPAAAATESQEEQTNG